MVQASEATNWRSPVPKLCANRRRGGALVLALASVAAVTVAGAAFLQLSATSTRRQLDAIDNKRAFYLAEGGLAESYSGIKLGKTGNVGSEEAPARLGQGLFWVEVEPTESGDLRLDSTGMAGSGRVELSLFVRPGVPSTAPLGIFSRKPVTIQAGTEIDGYDSRVGYDGEEEAPEGGGGSPIGGLRGGGSLAPPASGLSGGVGIVGDTIRELEGTTDTSAGYGVEAPPELDLSFIPGRIGSDGSITVVGTSGSPTVLNADVTVGPGQSVNESGDTTITGTAAAGDSLADFHAIEVPAITPSEAGIDHGFIAPFVIPPGNSHYPFLRIRGGSEVIVQGPATLVLEELDVARGAELTLDATAGPIDVYVSGQVELASGSTVTLPKLDPTPNDLRIQIVGNEPALFASTGAFYGYVYAPDATVSLAASTQYFGSLVADQLVLAPGCKVHFDQALAENAAKAGLPKQLSWTVVEMDVVRDPGGGRVADPFLALGVDRMTLDFAPRAHEDQLMKIEYYDSARVQRTYAGLESGFDWSDVRWITRLSRTRGSEEVDVMPNVVTGSEVRGVLARG